MWVEQNNVSKSLVEIDKVTNGWHGKQPAQNKHNEGERERGVNSGFEQSHFRGFARATLEYHGQHFFATNPPVT